MVPGTPNTQARLSYQKSDSEGSGHEINQSEVIVTPAPQHTHTHTHKHTYFMILHDIVLPCTLPQVLSENLLMHSFHSFMAEPTYHPLRRCRHRQRHRVQQARADHCRRAPAHSTRMYRDHMRCV